uniref:Uncharacterized protein n=1 Tax=Cacopsylla melanoneura TaxID=428564 RepID=A0A8D9AUW6_9HEMI
MVWPFHSESSRTRAFKGEVRERWFAGVRCTPLTIVPLIAASAIFRLEFVGKPTFLSSPRVTNQFVSSLGLGLSLNNPKCNNIIITLFTKPILIILTLYFLDYNVGS